MAYADPANDIVLPQVFATADSLSFKLFFSFDYAGNGPWAISRVVDTINTYKGYSSYYRYNGLPFVSTFEGPNEATDWTDIKSQTGGIFFVPDWSSDGAEQALDAGKGIVDALFSKFK